MRFEEAIRRLEQQLATDLALAQSRAKRTKRLALWLDHLQTWESPGLLAEALLVLCQRRGVFAKTTDGTTTILASLITSNLSDSSKSEWVRSFASMEHGSGNTKAIDKITALLGGFTRTADSTATTFQAAHRKVTGHDATGYRRKMQKD